MSTEYARLLLQEYLRRVGAAFHRRLHVVAAAERVASPGADGGPSSGHCMHATLGTSRRQVRWWALGLAVNSIMILSTSSRDSLNTGLRLHIETGVGGESRAWTVQRATTRVVPSMSTTGLCEL